MDGRLRSSINEREAETAPSSVPSFGVPNMMTPDELMAHRRAEAIAAAAVDHDQPAVAPPPTETPEVANVRRLAEMRAARIASPASEPFRSMDLPSNNTVSSPNERTIGSLDQLNSYFRDVHGYNSRGYKPWVPSK